MLRAELKRVQVGRPQADVRNGREGPTRRCYVSARETFRGNLRPQTQCHYGVP